MPVEPTGPALGQGQVGAGRLWRRIAEGTAGAGPLAHRRHPWRSEGKHAGDRSGVLGLVKGMETAAFGW
jgi:hypothetical protein